MAGRWSRPRRAITQPAPARSFQAGAGTSVQASAEKSGTTPQSQRRLPLTTSTSNPSVISYGSDAGRWESSSSASYFVASDVPSALSQFTSAERFEHEIQRDRFESKRKEPERNRLLSAKDLNRDKRERLRA